MHDHPLSEMPAEGSGDGAARRLLRPPTSVEPMDTGLLIALVGVGGTAFGALIGSVSTAALSARNARRTENRVSVRTTSNELLSALGAVRAVTLRSLEVDPIGSEDVAAAVTIWGNAVTRREGQLPSEARHAGRSIVDALAEHVGIAARAHTEPKWGALPLSGVTEDGRETAIAYIDYVGEWIGRSEQKGAWLPGPTRYHVWVREYERRRSEPMPSRLDAILRLLARERAAG